MILIFSDLYSSVNPTPVGGDYYLDYAIVVEIYEVCALGRYFPAY
jgi:hypothetical protein